MKSIADSNKKIWSVGTLTYTSGGLILLFFWLLWGDFTWAMKDRAVGPSATLLIRSFGVSDLAFSLIIVAFPNFTNIFLCPVVSYLSDRHRGKWGRRIPYLFFTTPFIVVGLIGLGFVRFLGTQLSGALGADVLPEHAAQLIFFGIFWVLLDFGTTLAGSLFGALVNDVVPSELLGRFFALFRAVSLVAGMLFNFFLIGLVEIPEYSRYIFVGIGIFYGIGLYCLCFRVKEGEYPPVPVAARGEGGKIFTPILTYFRQCFSIPYYRWVVTGMVLGFFCSTPVNIFSIFYAKSLEVDMKLYGIFITVTYAVSLAISYFLGILADRFHPLRTGIVSLAVYLATMIAGWVFVDGARSFGVILILHGIVSGCFFTLAASLGQRLFPKKLFAQFNSAFAMLLAIVSVTCGPFFGWLLDRLNHNYRFVFLIGGLFTLLAILALWKVHRYYLEYGGDAAYTPPDPESSARVE